MTSALHSRGADTVNVDQLIVRLNGLGGFLTLHASILPTQPDDSGWIAEEDLHSTDQGPQLAILDRLAAHGFGGSRRALSASLLLRYGWSSGLLIGAWLASSVVIRRARLALRFSDNAVLTAVALQSYDTAVPASPSWPEAERRMLAAELVRHASPIVDAHHRWSGFSRKALWSMVTSSWAAQFAYIGERLNAPERGLSEAIAVLSIHAEIRDASPELYLVRADGKRGVCQMRRLCCLWFKTGQRQFCTSCPIIPAHERMARNIAWIAKHGLPDNIDTQRA